MISYEPFWKTLKDKKVSTYALINKYNISSATIDRMKKGKGISTMKVDDFCRILNCNVSDIIEYIDEGCPVYVSVIKDLRYCAALLRAKKMHENFVHLLFLSATLF